MSLLRGLLFENLGLKFVALLLSVLVYLNARTDRPVTLLVSFPVTLEDVPDSVAVASPAPPPVQAEIRGTGKQVLLLRFSPPPLAVSLAGVREGRYERSINAADLPVPDGLEVERLVGPRMISLELDRRARRRVPVAPRIDLAQAAAARSVGRVLLEPAAVMVSGPAGTVAKLDSVGLAVVRMDGRRDTVRVQVGPAGLPERCAMEPPVVRVTVVLGPGRS
jgi:YbbR domain-containing protein